jgi:hypothetical protein
MDIIKNFCKDARYFLVQLDEQNHGKILSGEELGKINLNDHEIYRSIEYQNGDYLFAFDLKPLEYTESTPNQMTLLLDNLKEARMIETIYPNIFKWVYDGLSVKAYAIVPSSDFKQNTTITRYGGSETFIKILKQHLRNISKLSRGLTPDYNFLRTTEIIKPEELSIGSINKKTNMYSISIDLKDSWKDILYDSKINKHKEIPLNTLHMKYWTREINPDFIVEAKHIKISEDIDGEKGFKLYPPCIKQMINLKNKGNYVRFLIARYFLSAHNNIDAKHNYETVLTEQEREHIKSGNCSTQWNFIMNNMKRYNCPSCSELRKFCDPKCKFGHPLQPIQEAIENAKAK